MKMKNAYLQREICMYYQVSVLCPRHLSKEAEKDTGCYCRTDHSSHVRCHRVHEQMVVLVELASYVLRYAGCVRNCRYSGISDERIDLAAFLAEQIHEFHECYSADCCDNERKESEKEDLDRIACEEFVCLSRAAYSDTDEDGHNVDERSAG